MSNERRKTLNDDLAFLDSTTPSIQCKLLIDERLVDCKVSNYRPARDSEGNILANQRKLDIEAAGYPNIFGRWDMETFHYPGIFQQGRTGRLGSIPKRVVKELIELQQQADEVDYEAASARKAQQSEGREPEDDYATSLPTDDNESFEPPF